SRGWERTVITWPWASSMCTTRSPSMPSGPRRTRCSFSLDIVLTGYLQISATFIIGASVSHVRQSRSLGSVEGVIGNHHLYSDFDLFITSSQCRVDCRREEGQALLFWSCARCGKNG